MSSIRVGTVAPILLILTSACGSSTSPSAVSYAGQWSGTTSQGTPFTFVVSPEQKVTALTFGYRFSGCTGSLAFSPAAAITNVPTAPVPVGSASYESAPVGTPNRTLVSFLFTSPTDAHGMAIFVDYAGCDAVVNAAWTATRR